MLRGAAHNHGSFDVGFGSRGVAGAERHLTHSARHPAGRTIDGRRREARVRTGAADYQKAPARRRRRVMKTLKAIVLDVDGVLTDGGVWWGPGGEEWKRFSFTDIMGVSLARKAGLIVTLISGEDSRSEERRVGNECR